MKTQILSKKAPQPVGPYSQAVKVENLIFVSGILPINTDDKSLENDTVKATERILTHLDSILSEAGLERENVIKSTIFMTDLSEFSKVNLVYSEYFKDVKVLPARSTFEVKALPMGAKVEMEFILS